MSIKSLLLKVIFIGLVALPITFLIEVVSGDDIAPFTSYILSLGKLLSLIGLYIDWIIIAITTYIFCKNSSSVFYTTGEAIRTNRLLSEVARWSKTPYIPPLLYHYLLKPPVSASPKLSAFVNHRLYHEAMNHFRNRVYINASYLQYDPPPRQSTIKIIGLPIILKAYIPLALATFFFAYSVLTSSVTAFVTSWERFSIPVLIFIFLYSYMKSKAFVVFGPWTFHDKELITTFQELEPRVTWRELFPDTDRGQNILKRWQAEQENRMRAVYRLRNMVIPDKITNFDYPALAPYPYPSTELPDWVDQAEIYYKNKKGEWQAEEHNKMIKAATTSKGKVVAFPGKKTFIK